MGRQDYRDQFEAARLIVLERDGYACRKCGRKWDEIHHVNGYMDNAPENLRTLCRRCHQIAPMGKEYYEWEAHGVDGWMAAAQYAAKQLGQEKMPIILEAMEKIERFQKFPALIGARSRKTSGRKPYGYYPGEPEVIEQMRTWQNEMVPLARIVRLLNEQGIKPRIGTQWFPYTVARILAR